MGIVVVRAEHDIVEGKFATEDVVHEAELVTRQQSTRNRRLICRGDQHEARLLEVGEQRSRRRVDPKLFQAERGLLMSMLGLAQIENPVAFEENCSFHQDCGSEIEL